MTRTFVLRCPNCGQEHRHMSVLYCAECEQRDDETWFPWRDRLAQRRNQRPSIERATDRLAHDVSRIYDVLP